MINNKRLQAAEGGTEMSFSLKTLCMAGILAASALPPAAAQEVALRIHHSLPPQAPVPAHFIAPWAVKVTRESGGRIAFADRKCVVQGRSLTVRDDFAGRR